MVDNPQLLTDLFRAYYCARKNKRNTINQLKFELHLEENILCLYRQLLDRSYRVGRSVAFIIERPIKREVFAAEFSDRVIHHLYFNYTNDIFERNFISDSYSCRVGRGTSYGIKRLDHHIRSCSENYTKMAYVMKLDLSGYFMAIDRKILFEKITKILDRNKHLVPDYDLIQFLTREIVFNNPIDNCLIKGEQKLWRGLPKDKSLFHSAAGCGLPIGNLTSQLFSNVYLNDFDHFVKRTLKIKHYGRYVDDFFIIHSSKQFLNKTRLEIKDYLEQELHAKLHPNKIYIQNIYRGVSFLGAIIKPHRIYIARRSVSNFKTALARGEKYFAQDPVYLVQLVTSFLGLAKHYKTHQLKKRILARHPWISKYFDRAF